MAILLHIDTATDNASVSLSDNDRILAIKESSDQKNHAAFVQVAIKELLVAASINMGSIEAVSVTAGPGSYTGLRVGLSSAKGLCYALNKPLIMVNTLEVIALASIETYRKNGTPSANTLYAPLIDARRSEVFTAVYSDTLQSIQSPSAMILHEDSFLELLNKTPIVFSGNGSFKLKDFVKHENAFFIHNIHHAGYLATIANNAFKNNVLSNLAYSEPYYLKEFYQPLKK